MTVFTAGVKLLNPEICFYTVTETDILITNIIRIRKSFTAERSKQVCRSKMYAGRQTDRRTDAGPLHYALHLTRPA